MAIIKNTASQGLYVYAHDTAADVAKTGDAGQITATISKDGAAAAATNDLNPTEIGGGVYWFDLLQAETNAGVLALIPVSATADVALDPVLIVTTEQTGDSFARLGVAGAGLSHLASDARVVSVAQFLTRKDAALATDKPGLLTDINANTGTGAGTYDNTTDSQEALRDRGDAAWATATGFATPTNITAGTITTVTNLTNAPTAGDLTATMKTSVETAATAALTAYDPPTNAEMVARTLASADYLVEGDTLAAVTTVGSVTGAVGSVTGAVGSVTGAVGSVTAPVTAGTVSDKTGYALTAAYDAAKTAATQASVDLLSGGVAGSGAISHTITVDDGVNPLDGAEVWVSTDLAGTNVVAGTLSTDAMGEVTFLLDAGTYYKHVQLAGYNFAVEAFTVA